MSGRANPAWKIALFAAFAVACRKGTRPGTADAAPAPSVASPISVAPEPSASVEPPAPPSAPRSTCPYDRAMARARAATRAGRWEEAFSGFHEALHARPFDADAWAERGYAEMLAGEDPETSLLAARSLTEKPELLNTIWFNEAEMYARRGKKEEARLRYALADRLGNPRAAAKLGADSRCAATWTTRMAAIPFVQGWVAVLDVEPEATCGDKRAPKTTSREAKNEACRACTGLEDPLAAKGSCGADETGPWTIANGHLQCHELSIFIEPLGHDRYVVQPLTDEEKPTRHERTPDGFRTRAREFLFPEEADAMTRVSAAITASGAGDDGCSPDVPAGVKLQFSKHCTTGEASVAISAPMADIYWDSAGRGRLAISTYTNDMPTVTFRGATAHVVGAGCDAFVPLGRTPDAGARPSK